MNTLPCKGGFTCRVTMLRKIGLCPFAIVLLASCAQTQAVPILWKKQYVELGQQAYYGIVYEPKLPANNNYEPDYSRFAKEIQKAVCYYRLTPPESNCSSKIDRNISINNKVLSFSTFSPGVGKRQYDITLDYAPDTFPTDRILVQQRDDSRNTNYVVNMTKREFFYFERFEDAQRLADDFVILQQRQKRQYDAHMANFEALAAQYRALPVKPIVTEEQRKYIVQANSMRQQKQYSRAVEIFRKALESNPTSYPEAYFNIALLAAETGELSMAISNMKKYLLLMPGAKDARSAQDKIYEWEGLIQEMAR